MRDPANEEWLAEGKCGQTCPVYLALYQYQVYLTSADCLV